MNYFPALLVPWELEEAEICLMLGKRFLFNCLDGAVPCNGIQSNYRANASQSGIRIALVIKSLFHKCVWLPEGSEYPRRGLHKSLQCPCSSGSKEEGSWEGVQSVTLTKIEK